MKLVKNKYDKLLTGVLALASIFVITEGNRWHEPFLYTLAVTVTMYSYVIAIGMAISITVATTWSVVHSFKMVEKIRQDNLQLVKSMIDVMDNFSQHKLQRLESNIK